MKLTDIWENEALKLIQIDIQNVSSSNDHALFQRYKNNNRTNKW